MRSKPIEHTILIYEKTFLESYVKLKYAPKKEVKPKNIKIQTKKLRKEKILHIFQIFCLKRRHGITDPIPPSGG